MQRNDRYEGGWHLKTAGVESMTLWFLVQISLPLSYRKLVEVKANKLVADLLLSFKFSVFPWKIRTNKQSKETQIELYFKDYTINNRAKGFDLN